MSWKVEKNSGYKKLIILHQACEALKNYENLT